MERAGPVHHHEVKIRHAQLPANAVWRKLLHSGFETCFGPSTFGAGIRYQNTSQIQILHRFEKKGGAMFEFGIAGQQTALHTRDGLIVA